MADPARPDGSIYLLMEKFVALAQSGLAYSVDVHDRERFVELQRLCAELFETLSAGEASLAALYSDDVGYRTPKVDVRAVVFRADTILLVRERSDGKWTVPGGWADIGESPAECAVRELREESGYCGRAQRLLALFDREQHDHDPAPWHVYKVFFLCEVDGQPEDVGHETDEVGFFPVHGLPVLSTGRVTEKQIRMLYDAVRSGDGKALFD